MDQSGGKPLIELEDHIADKGVTDHNIGIAGRNIPGFDIAYKVDPFTLLQQREYLLDQRIALFLLCPYIDKGDAGILDSGHISHIDGPHLRKLDQLGGAGIHVGSAVDQKDRSLGSGHQRRERRALDSPDPSHKELSAGKCRPGTACRHESITGSFLYKLQSFDN